MYDLRFQNFPTHQFPNSPTHQLVNSPTHYSPLVSSFVSLACNSCFFFFFRLLSQLFPRVNTFEIMEDVLVSSVVTVEKIFLNENAERIRRKLVLMLSSDLISSIFTRAFSSCNPCIEWISRIVLRRNLFVFIFFLQYNF